jgi:hypothetical protein
VIYCGHFSLGPAFCYQHGLHLSALPTRQRGLRGLACAQRRLATTATKGFLRRPTLLGACCPTRLFTPTAASICLEAQNSLNFNTASGDPRDTGPVCAWIGRHLPSRFQMSVFQAEYPGLILKITDKDLPPIRYAGRLIRPVDVEIDQPAPTFALIFQLLLRMKINTCAYMKTTHPSCCQISTPIATRRGTGEHTSSAARIPMHTFARLRKLQPFSIPCVWARWALVRPPNLS